MAIASSHSVRTRVVLLLLLAALCSAGQIRVWAQAACANLTLTITDSPDPVTPGGTITYTIDLSRPTPLSNATFTDVLPAGVTFESLTAPGGTSCTKPAVGLSGTVSCTFDYDPVRIYGLTSANQLVRFAGNTPGTVVSTVPVTGLQAGESLLAIDVRPATQGLYGLGSTSRLYLINATTGAATQIGSAGAFTLSGTAFDMDFNPTVDRIRVVSDTEQNIRINPDTGALAATDTPLNPAGNVVAAAYANNVAGATSTTLYVIDSNSDQLLVQNPPNAGVLTVIGSLGVDTSAVAGFDIVSTNTAYALLTVGGISREYRINLTTGAATLVGSLPSNTFTDIAIDTSVVLQLRFTLAVKTSASLAPGTQISNTVTVSSSSEPCSSSATAVTTIPTPSTMTLAPSTVNFGVINASGTLTAVTPAQVLRLTQTGTTTVTWNASTNVPWLSLSPTSGTGPANIVASITSNAGLLPPPGAAAATVTIATVGATNSPTATVNLTVISPGQQTAPFGVVDTPQEGQTNVTGAIAMTGWALDDVGVSRLRILRSPVSGEDPTQLIYIGDAVFVDGARPDVAAAYPTTPLKDQAGWGYMLLTNVLPGQGNGRYTFWMYADDVDGHSTLLGTRTFTCSNATATEPFGTIDTPAQGATISGSSYANFGWVLTPQPKFIPFDGSTIQVLIDSVPVGGVTYNNPRADIQQLFPGYQNTDGAVGVRTIDTTALANGVHTIAWIASDSDGVASGLGSRYFTVSNSSGGSLRLAPVHAASAVISANALAEDAPVLAPVKDSEIRRFRTAQLERLVVELGDGAEPGVTYRGYAIAGEELKALPVGSHLDPDTGVFSWAPGLAFGGTHQLVFVRRDASGERQIRVDVTIDAQRASDEAARVVIDTPTSGQEAAQPFVIAGWAIDPAGPQTGSGIDVLHVWAHPVDGSAPLFVGVAAYGGERPDVARHFGRRYLRSGFGSRVEGLPPGTYDIAVYGFSLATGRFSVAASVRVTVK